MSTSRPCCLLPPGLRYDNGGGSMAAEALSNARAGGGRADRRIFLSQIKDEGLGVGAPAWVQVRNMGGRDFLFLWVDCAC